MLVDQVRSQMQEATKSGNVMLSGTLKMLMAALEYKRGQKMAEFGADDELAVIKSEVKKRQEAMEIYSKAGQVERANQEKQELEILQQFMPEQIGEDEIRAVVEELKDKAPSKGQLIGMVIGRLGKDKVDGTLVVKIVNELAG